MYFIFIGADRSGCLDLRRATKAIHSAYLDTGGRTVEVLMSGPTTDAAGNETGSVMVLRAESEDDVRAFFRDEPYHLADLYDRTMLLPWLWKRGNPYE